MVLIAEFNEHMGKTPSQATCSGGSYSTPLVLAATTTPTGATAVIGEPVSTFCVANAPKSLIPVPFANRPTPSGDFFNLPSTILDGATSTCGNSGPLYATSNQPHALLQRGATTEGHGSSACPVTRGADGRELMDKFAGDTLESYGSVSHPHGLAFCECAHGDDYDTWDWEHGWDPWRALFFHDDDVEDGLSKCATVSAGLACASHGHHLEVDKVIAIAVNNSW